MLEIGFEKLKLAQNISLLSQQWLKHKKKQVHTNVPDSVKCQKF